MRKDRREDWGSYESDPGLNRKIREDLVKQQERASAKTEAEEREKRQDQLYSAFLEHAARIGKRTSPFAYTRGKIKSLETLGIHGLRGFGSFEDMLINLINGTFDDKARVAVSSAYQKAIKEAEEYLISKREAREIR